MRSSRTIRGWNGPTQTPKRVTGAQQTDSLCLRCGFGSPSVSIISPIMSIVNHLSTSTYKPGNRSCWTITPMYEAAGISGITFIQERRSHPLNSIQSRTKYAYFMRSFTFDDQPNSSEYFTQVYHWLYYKSFTFVPRSEIGDLYDWR